MSYKDKSFKREREKKKKNLCTSWSVFFFCCLLKLFSSLMCRVCLCVWICALCVYIDRYWSYYFCFFFCCFHYKEPCSFVRMRPMLVLLVEETKLLYYNMFYWREKNRGIECNQNIWGDESLQSICGWKSTGDTLVHQIQYTHTQHTQAGSHIPFQAMAFIMGAKHVWNDVINSGNYPIKKKSAHNQVVIGICCTHTHTLFFIS